MPTLVYDETLIYKEMRAITAPEAYSLLFQRDPGLSTRMGEADLPDVAPSRRTSRARTRTGNDLLHERQHASEASPHRAGP